MLYLFSDDLFASFCVQILTNYRHSRAGGNPDLCISEILKDYCKSKILDSRLRGNDGGEVFLDSYYRHSIGVFCKQKHHSV